MTHPVEDGSSVADHQVFQLDRIDMNLTLSGEDFVSVYNNILEAYNKSTLFIVQTKTSTFNNMIIEKMPHDESANNYKGISLRLSFVQFETTEAQITYSPVNAKDSTRVNRGKQSGTDSTADENTSTAKKAYNFIAG